MKPRPSVTQMLAFGVTLALSTAALADDHRHFPVRVVDHRGVVWGHGDIRHFHDFDDHAWRGGRWVHDWHDNHFGWWWIVGGAWVFYNAPVYPYPDPYVPSTVIVQQAPPPVPAAAPAPAYWYYCASAQNYYPYVTQCPVGWEQVPATPATMAAPAQAAPPPPQGSMPPAPPPPQGTMPPAPPAPPADDNTW